MCDLFHTVGHAESYVQEVSLYDCRVLARYCYLQQSRQYHHQILFSAEELSSASQEGKSVSRRVRALCTLSLTLGGIKAAMKDATNAIN